jgi:prepilin-type N-terminal cleavage/methylation domain-containing protein
MRRSFKPTGRRGFTIVELIVVIGIVAVLAAILFPVFAQAREKAQQERCARNLYQVGMALQLYARDFDGKLPPRHNDLAPVEPYVRDSAALRCPTDPSPEPGPSGSYQYRGGLTVEDRADVPLAGDWEFRHNGGAETLVLSGSVKWMSAKDWVPIAPGARRLPAGVTLPTGTVATPTLDGTVKAAPLPEPMEVGE